MTSRFDGNPIEWKRGMSLSDVEAQMYAGLFEEIERYLAAHAGYYQWCRENGREP